MSIPEVIQKLDEKSIISKNGMGGTEVVVSEVEDAKDSD